MATIVGPGQQDDVISFLDIHMKENGKQSFNYYIGLTRDPGILSLFRKWSIWTTSLFLFMTNGGEQIFLNHLSVFQILLKKNGVGGSLIPKAEHDFVNYPNSV